MGADFPEDEQAIAMLRSMPVEARSWLHHHFGNSLQCVIGGIQIGDYEMARNAAQHAVEDLRKIK